MILAPEDARQFYRLHKALMLYVNKKLKVVKNMPTKKGPFPPLPPEQRLKVRDALLEHMDLIEDFADENPFDFPAEDLEIVRSWKHLVAGKFVVFRHLKKHTIFLTMEEPTVAYGVLALSDPFAEVIETDLPVMGETVLLPFKGRIIYDGLMTTSNVAFGSGYRRSFKESYDQAKERLGIVTSLPVEEKKKTGKGSKTATMPKKKGNKGRAVGRKAKPRAADAARSPLVGSWRITWMEQWDQSFVDAEMEGFIRFDEDGSGEFHFGYVHGNLNYQETEHNDRPAAVFTFEGNDEMDPCSGRGWAFRKGDQILGKIVFHGGDESKFKAIG